MPRKIEKYQSVLDNNRDYETISQSCVHTRLHTHDDVCVCACVWGVFTVTPRSYVSSYNHST